MSVTVTLAEAKMQAKITHDAEDALLQSMLDASEKLVLDAVKNRVSDAEEWSDIVDAWDEDSVLPDIKAAILYQFVTVEKLRGGDDPKLEPEYKQGLAPLPWMIVKKYGDPSLA